MLDAGQIASGVASHAIGLGIEKNLPSDYTTQDAKFHSETVIDLLSKIHLAVSTERDNIDEPFALQPYPYEYTINSDWHNRPHICVFFATSTPLRIDIDGIGTYLKTVGPGWVICDVHGRMSTTDSTNHNVIVSYRLNEIGATTL